MNDKLERIQEILNRSGFKWLRVSDYDFTQPDDMDEMDSDGVWDLATNITDWCLDNLNQDDFCVADCKAYGNIRCMLQTMLYNLIAEYKDVKGE